MYARTKTLYAAERYNSVLSPPVTLRGEELGNSVEAEAEEVQSLAVGRIATAAAAAAAAAAGAGSALPYGCSFMPGQLSVDEALSLHTAAQAAAADADAGDVDPGAKEDWWFADCRRAVPWRVPNSGALLRRDEVSPSSATLALPRLPRGQAAAAAAAAAANAALSPLAGVPSRALLDAPRRLEPRSLDSSDVAATAVACEQAAVSAPLPPPAGGGKQRVVQEAKRYKPLFAWGQMAGWFKQTVQDPSASLGSDRRGTVQLPDAESCYSKYSLRERAVYLTALCDTTVNGGGGLWPLGTLWSFKTQNHVYGSPMLDAAVARSRGEEPQLSRVVQELITMPSPSQDE
jgi:hypothetical protein